MILINANAKHGYTQWKEDGWDDETLEDVCDLLRTKWPVGHISIFELKPGYWWWDRKYKIHVLKIGNKFEHSDTFGEYRYFDTQKEAEAAKVLRSLE